MLVLADGAMLLVDLARLLDASRRLPGLIGHDVPSQIVKAPFRRPRCRGVPTTTQTGPARESARSRIRRARS